MMTAVDRLEAALAKAAAALEENRAELSKGFPNGEAEAGVHVHNLEREKGRTKLDGLHRHLFRLPAAVTFRAEEGGAEVHLEEGALLATQEDGPHLHRLEVGGDLTPRRDVAGPAESVHRHILVLVEDAIELITEKDGVHAHQLQTFSTAFDGTHEHRLRLGDLELVSLSGAAFWEAIGEPAQESIPPAPPASELAQLAEGVALPPEELEVRIANVGKGKTTLVLDAVEDVAKLADLDPALASIAQCGPVEELAVAVLAGRLAGTVPAVVWQAEPPKGVLPALKVPDPKFLVERLRDGKPAALLSRRRRVARVGKPQALINEVAPTGLGKALVWAVVAQADPIAIETMADLSDEQKESLDAFTAREFSTESGLWYLPLELVVIFDPPLELRRPPPGRRFGSSVDFDRDVLKTRQVTIDELLRQAARRGAHGFVADPSPDELRRSTPAELVELDRQLHRIFERSFAESDVTQAEGVTREDVINAHVFVLAELERRGVQTVEVDSLAEETVRFLRGETFGEEELLEKCRPIREGELAALGKALPDGEGKTAPIHPSGERAHADDPVELEEVLAQLSKPMSIRMPAVYVVGSICNAGRSENDIDILIRGPFDEETLHAIKFRLGRALEPRLSRRVQFLHEPAGGPYTNHVALYDLVLVPHEDRTLKEMADVAKQDDPMLDWPPEPGPVPAVLQFHFRGKTLHADLRMKVDPDYLVGWTIALQKAGAVPEVNTLADGRKIVAAFDVEGSRYTKPMILPARLFATPKSRQPVEWLELGDAVVEPGDVGATRNEPGVYIEVARPKVEWGLQKPAAHEYFVTGEADFAGRLTFRLLQGDAGAGEDVGHGSSETFWTCGFAKDVLPSVLDRRSVRTRSMPPLGQSGMPRSLMQATPREFRFWEADSEREAREVRDALVAERFFTSENVVVVDGEFRRVERKVLVEAYDPEEGELGELEKAAARVDFSLAWQWWKGQTVVRAAPSRQIWHLAIEKPGGGVYDFQLQRDPLSGEEVISAVLLDAGKELLGFEGDVPPGTEVGGVAMNETKATPSSVELVDRGRAELLEDGRTFKRVRFRGEKLRGLFSLVAEETGSDLWQFSPGGTPARAIPEEKARGDGHVHALPEALGEGFTDPAAGRDHRHRVRDGLETGLPVQDAPGRDVRHWHLVELEGEELPTGTERSLAEVGIAKRHRVREDGTQVWDPREVEDGDDKGGERLELRPPALFQPMKPAPRATNEFTDPDEAARQVFSDQLVRAGVQVEPKLNGFRAIAEKWEARVDDDVREGGVLVFTEDAQRDIAPNLRGLAAELEAVRGSFILDGEIMAVDAEGSFLPRRELSRFRVDKPVDDEDLRFVVFDLLYSGGDVHVGRAQGERRRLLERFWRESGLSRATRLVLAPRRIAKTRSALRRAITWATKEPGSEGAMMKQLGSTYSLGGEQDLWAKVKAVREVRAIVAERNTVEGSPGVYNFVGAVGPIPSSEVEEWKEVLEIDGRPYVHIGRTGNRKLDAKVGDTILVQTFELLWEEGPPKRIRWFGPAQAIDILDGAPMKPSDVRLLLRPGELEKRAETSKRIVREERPVRLLKRDGSEPEERYVFGVVLVPDEPDAQGDIYSADEVRKAAHSFMEHFGGDTFKVMHNGKAVDGIVVLETYLAKVRETHGGETFPVGTWFLATRVLNDDVWEAVKRGAFTGYSMGGTALRESLAS